MPNKNIFCGAPWHEFHIYHDGGLGTCCQEQHRIYDESDWQKYNIRNMSIKEWYNSQPMRQARLSMFGDNNISFCTRCYHEMSYSNTSRRHKTNQKVVIFTKTAFDQSYLQSPAHDVFENSRYNDGEYDGMPVDLHIDLGNYCNLACKMCSPRSSSNIAIQHKKWGIKDAEKYIGADWTRDEDTWIRTLTEIASITNLKNVHFMGGETLITKKFEEFVDFMIEHGRTDLQLSFVHNGTIYNQQLLDKLKKFARVGIELSIETMDQRNEYIRQGTDNVLVMKHLEKYLECNNGSSITITLRPAISALSVGTLHELFEFCLTNNLVIKSNLVYTPDYLEVKILPQSIKKQYQKAYEDLITKYSLDSVVTNLDYNESDPNLVKTIIKSQIDMVIQMLDTPDFPDNKSKLKQLVRWCERWDKIYGFDARKIYPEFLEIFNTYDYQV